MKFLRIAGQTIEGSTWLFLHLLGHILLVLGCLTSLVDAGVNHSLSVIRSAQQLIILRLEEKV